MTTLQDEAVAPRARAFHPLTVAAVEALTDDSVAVTFDVPEELREGAYALGVPKWRTITKVVLPTALGGIITGSTLAVARVAGETAPLLLIAGTLRGTNFNPFDGAMQTLPVLIFSEATRGGLATYVPFQIERAWGAALVLIIIVMLLNLLARVVGSFFSPKTGR